MGPALAAPIPTVVPPVASGVSQPHSAATVPLDHIVIVMQENHVYDNFFGKYCLVVGPYCSLNASGYPPGLCLPFDPNNLAKGCIRPYLFSPHNATAAVDLTHNWVTGHEAYDNGSMDNFYLAEGNHPDTFGYYDGTEIPTYWDIAEQYAMGDNAYASVLSYSTPNHWFLLAGQAPVDGYNQTLHKGTNLSVLTANEKNYLDEANTTATIEDVLLNSTVSWKYYDYALGSYGLALNEPSGAGAAESAFDYWNPLAARGVSYTPAARPHFVNSSEFFVDAANGTLPNVSWIMPTFNNSDHAPASLANGQSWVASIVNAVERSPDWNSTAIFVSWDDYGGYYDHQPPPLVDAHGVSFRAPFLVIGPYVRENYVSHHYEEFASLLHLIEWRFHLPAITARDQYAPLPLEYFDFAASPRPPLPIPGPSIATYPMPLQALGPPPPVTNLSGVAGVGSVRLSWTLPLHSAPVTAYTLAYGPRSNPNMTTMRIDGNLTSVTVSNLPSGSALVFQLAAVTAGNVSASSRISLTPSPGAFYLTPSTVPGWAPLVPNGTAPPPRVGATLAYDAADGVDVLFGGVDANGTFHNDTWVYTQDHWVRTGNTAPPPPRAWAGTATDPSTGSVLLFGGMGPNGYRSDTWRFVQNRWTNLTGLSGGTFPSGRTNASMAGDGMASGVLLFGGRGASGTLGDMWKLSGGHWTRISLTGTVPAARSGAAVAYLPANGYLMLFGGTSASGAILNDTWRFSGGSWRAVTATTFPVARTGAAFAFDIRDNEAVLTGGWGRSGGLLNDSWALVNGAWKLLHPTVPIVPHGGAVVTYDGLHQAILVGFGTTPGGVIADLWAFSPPLALRLTGSPTFVAAPGTVFFHPTVSGGLGAYTFAWAFGDGGRSTLLDGWHLFTTPGNYTVSFTVVDGGGVLATVTMPVRVT